MWPNNWSHHIKRLDGGNERIHVIGIEVKGCAEKLYVFNVYMPTHEANSLSKYNEHLDILHTLIAEYSSLGAVIICCDMSGKLISERSNRHDCGLKEFVTEHSLSWPEESMGTKSTFISHSGSGRSQIDYILCSSEGVLKTTTVEEKHFLNRSMNTVVSSLLDIQLKGNSNVKKKKVELKSRIKINWDKVDEAKYKSVLSGNLNSLHEDHSLDPGEALIYVGESLKEAAKK